ncbi:MAG: hypothetical protein ACR2HA_04930 [Nocardioides sp.]
MRSLVITASAAAALLAGCGSSTVVDGATRDPVGTNQAEDSTPVVAERDPLVTCGGPGFAVSAMSGGVDGLADRDEVAAALERLVAEAGIDAPPALRDRDVDEAQWFVLGDSGGVLTVATGRWNRNGPGPDGQVVWLERIADGWDAAGWGGCRLAPVAPPGRTWVEVTAQAPDLAPSATSVPVMVSERDCTGGRDPGPFLGTPRVVEEAQAVTIYWASTPPQGAAECPGNPWVRRVLELQEPLGDREILDGSIWPPRPAVLTPR